MRLGCPRCSFVCSRYHFRVYPGAGLANACPPEQEITMNCDVFRQNFQEPPLDCDFVCTGARQFKPKKSGAKGTHKLLPTWPEARLAKILIKRVPFQIAPDFRPNTIPKITVHGDYNFFRTLFLEFYRASSFYGATRTRETDSGFASGRQARNIFWRPRSILRPSSLQKVRRLGAICIGLQRNVI